MSDTNNTGDKTLSVAPSKTNAPTSVLIVAAPDVTSNFNRPAVTSTSLSLTNVGAAPITSVPAPVFIIPLALPVIGASISAVAPSETASSPVPDSEIVPPAAPPSV